MPIPHGNVKIFNKHGRLVKTVDVQERSEKMFKGVVEWGGTSFRCSKCQHTLNIEMVCAKCTGKSDMIDSRKVVYNVK